MTLVRETTSFNVYQRNYGKDTRIGVFYAHSIARRAVRLMNADLKADGIRKKDLHYYIEEETIVDPI